MKGNTLNLLMTVEGNTSKLPTTTEEKGNMLKLLMTVEHTGAIDGRKTDGKHAKDSDENSNNETNVCNGDGVIDCCVSVVAYGNDGGDEIDEITMVTSSKIVGIIYFPYQVRWLHTSGT